MSAAVNFQIALIAFSVKLLYTVNGGLFCAGNLADGEYPPDNLP